jgi:hypothetical protein
MIIIDSFVGGEDDWKHDTLVYGYPHRRNDKIYEENTP